MCAKEEEIVIRKNKIYKEAFKNFIVILLFAAGISISSFLVIKQALINKDKNETIEQSEQVDGKLEPTQLAIKINSVISLEDSLKKGNFGIHNKSNNIYDLIVKIYLKDTNELVYTSPKLKPGEKIEQAKLDKKIGKGVYKAVAYFEAYDEKNNYKGKSGIEIDINIRK